MPARPPIASNRPSTPPARPSSSTSVMCWRTMSRRLAPSARRSPVIGAALRNLASSRPTTLTRHTPRNMQRDADQHAVVALDDFVAVEPLLDVIEPVVERPLHPSLRLLAACIVVDERLELVAIGRGRQLGPELQPDAFRVEEVLVRLAGFRLPAVGIAVHRQFQRLAPAVRHVGVLGILERAVVEVEELGTRRPRLEHAHHAILDLAELDRLADAVRAAEDLLVGFVVQHDDGLRPLVGGRVPALAVLERHVEHGEELVRGHAQLGVERLDAVAFRDDQRARLVHHHAARGRLGAVQVHGVAVGQQLRRKVRLFVIVRALCAPGVERHRVKLVALVRNRVGRHRVVDRERHGADGDAQRDRQHHQRRQPRMALHAVEGEAQVVSKHGGTSLPGQP